MGYRYGRSIWEIGHQSDIDRDIDMEYVLSIWVMVIVMVIYHIDMVILDIDMGDEANDMGDDSIDVVISHIDLGYLVTLLPGPTFGRVGVLGEGDTRGARRGRGWGARVPRGVALAGGALNSVSGLVSMVWYRIPFNQTELSISRIPPTDSPTVRTGPHP